MSEQWRLSIALAVGLACLPLSGASAQDERGGIDLLCPLVEREHLRELKDYELELKLVENESVARRRVFEMVDGLWAANAIEKEIYLDYKRLHDRTKILVSRAKMQIEQQKSIVEQYEIACREENRAPVLAEAAARMRALVDEYHRTDCELLALDARVAQVDYDFDAAILQATRELTERKIKPKFELVVDEYDLSQSKARLQMYRSRARACKEKLASGGLAAER